MDNISDIIANLGFPIACVLGCAYFIYNNNKSQREDSQKREDRMFKQLENFGKTMDNFNQTLTKIDSRLEALENKVK